MRSPANGRAPKQLARTFLPPLKRPSARDGFEAARLEDIASLAGYTRGAFYANFKSKEDIFFALLDQWVGRRIAVVTALLAQQKKTAKRLQALRAHYAQIAKDRRLALLSLEFKLFAIRHPESHARLRAFQRRLRAYGADLVIRLTTEIGRDLDFEHRCGGRDR